MNESELTSSHVCRPKRPLLPSYIWSAGLTHASISSATNTLKENRPLCAIAISWKILFTLTFLTPSRTVASIGPCLKYVFLRSIEHLMDT